MSLITVDQLRVCFDRRPLFDGVSFRFECGRLSAVIGRNGSGKSTLLRVIAGLHRRYEGVVAMGGRDIRSLSAQEMARAVAYVSTGRASVPSMRVVDAVALGRTPYTGWTGRLSAVDREKVEGALASVGMTGMALRRLSGLSDGEAQRVMIARALAQDTSIIILDEPTSFLDPEGRMEIVGLLRRLSDEGKTVVYSTHEVELASRMAHSVVRV